VSCLNVHLVLHADESKPALIFVVLPHSEWKGHGLNGFIKGKKEDYQQKKTTENSHVWGKSLRFLQRAHHAFMNKRRGLGGQLL